MPPQALSRRTNGRSAALPGLNYLVYRTGHYALVFLLLAVPERCAVKHGVWTAIEVLFSQFVVFAILVILYDCP